MGALAARSQREARLLNTIKALQLALQRAAHQAAGNAPSNLKYMQVWCTVPQDNMQQNGTKHGIIVHAWLP